MSPLEGAGEPPRSLGEVKAAITQTAWVRRYGPSRPFPASPAQRAVRWQRTTLVLVVLILLGLIAIPQADRRARRRGLEQEAWNAKAALSEFRRAIQAYSLDHGSFPGIEPGPDGTSCEAVLVQQLVGRTSAAGEAGAGLSFGPYLPGGLPANPINGLTSVRVLGAEEPWPLSAEGAHGWVYDPRSGLLRLDADGRVPTLGLRYFDL